MTDLKQIEALIKSAGVTQFSYIEVNNKEKYVLAGDHYTATKIYFNDEGKVVRTESV